MLYLHFALIDLGDLDPRRQHPVEARSQIGCILPLLQFEIHDLAGAGHAHGQGQGQGKIRVRRIAVGMGQQEPRPAEAALEHPHQIQVRHPDGVARLGKTRSKHRSPPP